MKPASLIIVTGDDNDGGKCATVCEGVDPDGFPVGQVYTASRLFPVLRCQCWSVLNYHGVLKTQHTDALIPSLP